MSIFKLGVVPDLEMSTAKSAIMIRSQRAGSFLVIRTVQALLLTVNTRV